MGIREKIPLFGPRAVEWGKAIREAAYFSVQPRRFLPFFIADVLAISIAFLLIGSVAMPYGMAGTEALPPEVASAIVILAVVLIGWFLASLWITGALIHQSSKPKEYDRSWAVSARRYPNLLAVTLVVGLATFLLSAVPFIGLLLSLLATLAFLLVAQFVVLGKMSFHMALARSVKALRYKFRSIFLAWLIGGMLSLVLMLLFALPLLATISYFVAQYGIDDAILYMMVTLDWNVIYMETGILLLGFSVSRTFALHFLTDVYMQLNRKRFFIF